MTTIAEDLKTTIDTDFDHGTIAETVYVYAKTADSTTDLTNLDVPLANKVNIIVYEGIGVPIRYTNGSDLIVHEGKIIATTNTYATMILVMAELKQVADVLTTGSGELSFTVPAIVRLDDRFQATFRYKWEILTDRG